MAHLVTPSDSETQMPIKSNHELIEAVCITNTPEPTTHQMTLDSVVYRKYKRRWIGLIHLALLNVVVSWDVGTFEFVAHRYPNHLTL